MSSVPPRVHLVVAAYRRPELLARLLSSLANESPELAGIVVVNNGGDEAPVRAACEAAPVPVRLLTPVENLGTGGGIAAGLRLVLATPGATHAWIMDDDACASPGALKSMLEAQAVAGAEVVSPLVPDSRGIITWFPGPLAGSAWGFIRRGVSPAQFKARFGLAPLQWNWATWASLLVSRRAVESVGLPRADLWFQSTDIEYTLRLSARFRCVLAPAAVCPHLPPAESPGQRRAKDRWTLQNNAYITFRLAHGRRILRHLPGNHYRYWRRYRAEGGAWRDTFSALWKGAVNGRPVGAESFYALASRKD